MHGPLKEHLTDLIKHARRRIDYLYKFGLMPLVQPGQFNHATRYLNIARTQLEFGRMYFGKTLGAFDEKTHPYPDSFKPENCVVYPAADSYTADEQKEYGDIFLPEEQQLVQKVKRLRVVFSNISKDVATIREHTNPGDVIEGGGLNAYECLTQVLLGVSNCVMALGMEAQDMLNDNRGGAISVKETDSEKPWANSPNTSTSTPPASANLSAGSGSPSLPTAPPSPTITSSIPYPGYQPGMDPFTLPEANTSTSAGKETGQNGALLPSQAYPVTQAEAFASPSQPTTTPPATSTPLTGVEGGWPVPNSLTQQEKSSLNPSDTLPASTPLEKQASESSSEELTDETSPITYGQGFVTTMPKSENSNDKLPTSPAGLLSETPESSSEPSTHATQDVSAEDAYPTHTLAYTSPSYTETVSSPTSSDTTNGLSTTPGSPATSVGTSDSSTLLEVTEPTGSDFSQPSTSSETAGEAIWRNSTDVSPDTTSSDPQSLTSTSATSNSAEPTDSLTSSAPSTSTGETGSTDSSSEPPLKKSLFDKIPNSFFDNAKELDKADRKAKKKKGE